MSCCFFFNDTATTEIYTLSLHDALPISQARHLAPSPCDWPIERVGQHSYCEQQGSASGAAGSPHRRNCRSEEHTSELQSRQYLVCRLLLEKKKKKARPVSDT